jgi:hypothetical protein
MTRNNETILNHFLLNVPSFEVITSAWLESHGISSKLTWWYVHAGLLEKISSKAYKKTGELITWSGVVSSLQNQLKLQVHLGGKTALQVLGFSHFLMMQTTKHIQLFAPLPLKIPRWLTHTQWDSEFSIFKTSLFNDSEQQLGIIQQTIDSKVLRLSCPERAIMELFYLYPRRETFGEIVYLMENLNQLRPNMVQKLLEHCNSIKVKRVFLHLAEEFNHPWLAKLDLRNIDLGQGKRVIEPKGKYYPKYKISLPEIKGQ